MRSRDTWLLLLFCLLLVAAMYGFEKWRAVDGDKPYAIVTTFKGDPQTSRAFTWHTKQAGDKAVLQLVKGTDADFDGKDVMTVTGVTTVMELGSSEKRGVHKAEATGLEPGITYTYRVGSGEKGGWSEAATFVTESAGTEEEDQESFTFINVTDSQGETEQDFDLWGNTLDRAFATFEEAKLIVHNGDLTENPDEESGWTHLIEKAAKWVRSVPFMPVTGNHDEVEGNADMFISHFNLPGNGAEGSIEGTTYSFDYGLVHFVMLNSESNRKAQTEWLQDDLAATDKKWIVASIHQGPYGGNSYKKTLDWAEVFDEYGVDLVLQGHNHEYSRSYPLKGGEIVGTGDGEDGNREGTVYVVTNTSGQKFNEKKDDQFYHKVHFQNNKQMFAGITVDGNKLTYEAYDVDGAKLDSFVIVR
ncbi:metallophosphoesterase [Paenibacillus sp. 2TAB19]|uniref:metallophosphoesterase n=1 Tax=Paenibacillus sp. 2TAB19 TaxID=3233003 RepID=UPI003F975A0E